MQKSNSRDSSLNSTATKPRTQGIEQEPTPPSPSILLESLRNIGYTIETALADIIDNSISAEATQVDVRFLWDELEPWIAVIDNGNGMTPSELRTAMRFGSLSPTAVRAKNDLGRFGLGLKTASISQCRNLTVCTKSEGQLSACRWDLNKIAQSESDDWLLTILDDQAIKQETLLNDLVIEYLGHRESGTIVLWQKLDTIMAGTEPIDSERKFSELMSGARSHLETVFHRYLSPDSGQKAVKISFNNSELVAFNPFGPSIPARQEKQLEKISLNGESIDIQPYILPHANKVSKSDYERYAGEGGYLQNQGFYVYRNRRLIVKATWFRLIKKDELSKLVRVRIDIPNSLDHLWAINVDKSQVTPPEVVRKQLKRIIQRIAGAGKQVYRRKATRIKNREVTHVWAREVVDSKVSYTINEEHPLIGDLIKSAPSEFKNRITSCLKLISNSFPKEVYYNDVADDKTNLSQAANDSAETRELCIQLINALQACGFEKDKLRKRVTQTEIPGASPELIDSLLQEHS